MRDITDPDEIMQHEQELYEQRIKEQNDKEDFSFDEEGAPEKCSDCGAKINSGGYCPRCDY